jgi:multidrug efflux system membrane fusion protein
VGGTLLRIHFEEGHEVKRGDLLFEIDPRPYENAIHSAEAELEKTTVQLKMADAQVARYAALISGGMVSKEQYETVQNTAQALRATRAANEAAVANARLQLEYCSIHAPCDGRTGILGAHEGDLVRASDPNVALITLTQLSPIYVSFALPQQHLGAIQRYSAGGAITVRAAASDAPTVTGAGALSFIDSAVDAATGTIKLKATFTNAAHTLWPGQFARVTVVLTTLPRQIVVPTPAIQIGQRGPQVYVVRQDLTAELRSVTVDRAVGNETVVQGLAEGETVVVDGHLRLRPNVAVAVKPPVTDQPAIRATEKRRGPAAAGSPQSDDRTGAAAVVAEARP